MGKCFSRRNIQEEAEAGRPRYHRRGSSYQADIHNGNDDSVHMESIRTSDEHKVLSGSSDTQHDNQSNDSNGAEAGSSRHPRRESPYQADNDNGNDDSVNMESIRTSDEHIVLSGSSDTQQDHQSNDSNGAEAGSSRHPRRESPSYQADNDNGNDDSVNMESIRTSDEHIVLSEKFLKDVAGEIGSEWHMLFISLNLTNAELEQIDYDRGFNQRTKNFKAFLLWRKKNKQHHASEQLRLLIGGFADIGRQDLVEKYTGYLDEPYLLHISATESCDEEPDLNRLKERLVKINDLEIPLTPLQEDSDKLPVEQLFASVIIKEDPKETRKGKKSSQDRKEQERKEVKTPEDMLTKNGKPVRRVYMLGDAAHGKTTYCTWLLKKWCNAQKPGMSGRLNEWENALSKFDFVFHLKFRHVDPSRANVTDMICQDILGEDTGLHAAAKHVLSSDKYRCLIIMDGLDEWKSDQSVIAQLKYKAMPNIDNMSNCVIFTTMRPWMFAAVAGLVRDEDRVIEIQGLDYKGIEDVIEKVLVHYYEMKPDSDEYKAKYKEIISKLKDKTLKSFLHIPLLAVVCIQIWCEGEQVGNSLTSFYVAMVNMVIERAQVKKQIPKLSLDTTNLSLPRILSAKKNINSFSNVLLKLGKVAYEGLISKQMKLVFQKDDLESEIGERELKFALDVGLISQTEAPSITTRKVNVHFFHKSVQEFLAVIHIVTQKKVSDNFCTRLCNVKVIMELSNVIMFICGMCPSLGSVISQIVVSVADSDEGICKYSKSPGLGNDTVEELYKLQVSWYRELQYGQTDSQVTFHISDVYLAGHSDTETVRVTRELLSGHHDIRSLKLRFVPTDGEDGIPDTELGDFLSDTDKTRSLVRIYINGGNTVRSVHTLCIPSLRTLCLIHVTIQDRDSVRPVITQTDRLQRLELNGVSLDDRGLGLTPHMTDLQEVRLDRVSMTQSGWGRLIQSVIDIHHQFVVILRDTDIDSDSVSTLHSSPHISVTQDYVVRYFVKYGGRDIKFTRVWPLTHADDDDDDDDDDTMVGI